MVTNPRNVVVIGAGTMGSGIAAHLANIGFEVSLLDLTEDSVKASFEKARRSKPPHFYVADTAETVRLGSIQDNLEWVSAADWVCEAIVEKLDAKRDLFAMIEPRLRSDAYVSTNTSGLQISLLCEGRSEEFRRKFLGTHFFNPPRYLKLLELIPTPDTDPSVVDNMSRFLESECARRVVLAKDTPGFIANRYGMWCMYLATNCAEKLGLTIEEVDAITGPFLGRPRTGSFRLNDLVGLDIMEDIAHNLMDRCVNDPHREVLQAPRSLTYLKEKGWIGDKVGQGYYRREGKELMSLDLTGLGYRMRQEPNLPTLDNNARLPLADRLKVALDSRCEVGEFLRAYLVKSLQYAEYLATEISHSYDDFDNVMKWGFGWGHGPFELADMIGLPQEPYYKDGSVRSFSGGFVSKKGSTDFATLADFPVIKSFETFSVRDMGDGVILLSTKTKMGVLTISLVHELSDYLSSCPQQPLVLTSEAKGFSAGFDLEFLLARAHDKDWETLDRELDALQQLGHMLSVRPSVAAVYGFCLGGGFEVATSCSKVVALAESQIGLPEAKVGVIPGGGGTAHLRQRNIHSAKAMVEAARCLAQGFVSSNADEARKVGYLRREDVTVYHPDMLLSRAKSVAMSTSPKNEEEWTKSVGPVGGMIEQCFGDLQKAGEMTEHDHQIGQHIRHIFVKADTFEEALEKERAAFPALLANGLTVSRIKHMIDTGKPLKN